MIGSCYINVTGAAVTDRAQFQAEIEKLVASHALHGSESLCKLLRYLGRQALEHPGTAVKEYQIATIKPPQGDTPTSTAAEFDLEMAA